MLALKTFVRRMSSAGGEKCLNRVTLIGRVGADAQLKGTLEHPVVIFNMATNSGGVKTEWHRVSVFKPGLRQVAEEYVKSGSRLYMEGKLSYGHIIDSKGNAVPTTSIIAEEIIFLSQSKANSGSIMGDSTEQQSESASI